MRVQIVIRSCETKGYWGADGRWGHSEHARQFSSAQEADQFCRERGLKNVEIVVWRADRPPLCIPVRESRLDNRAKQPDPQARRSSGESPNA